MTERRNDSLIERAVRILDAFEIGEYYLSASEIARRTGLPVPTAHRIVAELIRSGVLERGPNRQVRIGLRLWELANRSFHHLSLRDVALPYMADLHAVVKQHTQLSVLDGTDVLYVERLSARGAVVNITQMASRLPARACAPGLVFTAYARPALREKLLSSPAVAFTPETVVDRAELEVILATIRSSGFATVNGWVHRTVTGLAAPIFDADGTTLAALSVLVPRGSDIEREYRNALLTTARGISRAVFSRDGATEPELRRLKHQARHATHRHVAPPE